MEAPHNVIWLLIIVAEASDRLRDAQSQLKEQDFSWQRLDAVTPKSDDFVYEKSKTKWYRDLTDGEIACYLSHRKAWRQAIDSKADYLVVLEDDLIVQSPLKKVVDELIKTDLSWDMIKLFETRNKRSVVRSLSHDFDIVDTPTVPIATTGYIIKVSCSSSSTHNVRFEGCSISSNQQGILIDGEGERNVEFLNCYQSPKITMPSTNYQKVEDLCWLRA